jgi:alkanesulfonate monooxygenase SsuD/methylene tetrahydromethanopterin reductase-like flavin-dependent oxidoreductase (luciferase family)
MGLGVSYGPFDVMARATGYYRRQCAAYGWTPGPDDIIYRCNMILGETDDAADATFARRDKQAPFPIGGRLREALIEADTSRNIAGQRQQANVGGVLPISFCGGPDRVLAQLRECREKMGTGVLDVSLTDPGTGNLDAMMDALALFGRTVLPRMRDI